jgi:hypothetical protein
MCKLGGTGTSIMCPTTTTGGCHDTTHAYQFSVTSPGVTYSLRIASSDNSLKNVDATIQLQ